MSVMKAQVTGNRLLRRQWLGLSKEHSELASLLGFLLHTRTFGTKGEGREIVLSKIRSSSQPDFHLKGFFKLLK